MPEVSLIIKNYSAAIINIEPTEIRGEGGPHYPRMLIPIRMNLKPIRNHTGKEIRFIILEINGSLFLQNLKGKIGDIKSENNLHKVYSHDTSKSHLLEIPLDLYRIEKIEEKRSGDVEFKLDLNFIIGLYEKLPLTNKEQQEINYKDFITDFEEANLSTNLKIPQSHWVNNIIPELGYYKMKLIEIPIPEKIIPDTFNNAINELNKGKKYFLEGDYDKVVSHCRNAIQLIPETFALDLSGIQKPSFNDKVKKFIEQYLSDLLSNSKREALEAILKATWILSSIPHHPSNIGYFNRADAETILLICTALISYCGKLLKQREEK